MIRTALLFLIPAGLYAFAHLTPETASAFDRYAEEAETKIMAAQHDRLRDGEIRTKQVDLPNGLLQDCTGAVYLPGITLAQVKAMLQDYDNYTKYYKPEVIEAKQTGRQGDEFDVFLRLYKKNIVTVVLNTNYHVRYLSPDAQHLYVLSRSTRIAEVKNSRHPDEGEHEVGNDTGFLWRLNSLWRFDQENGWVYAECEAVSLSRDVPAGLGWLIKGFLQKFPKESMLNTLNGTKSAILSRKTGE